MTRQYIEPQTQLELNELNNGIASLIISHQNNLIIVGGTDGGVCFIDRDTFEIMKTHKFNSLGTYFKYFLRVVQTQAILYLKSMPERVGSDILYVTYNDCEIE